MSNPIMVVYKIDGECGSKFFDSFTNALSFCTDVCCGVGGTAQIYEWQEENEDGIGGYYVLVYEG